MNTHNRILHLLNILTTDGLWEVICDRTSFNTEVREAAYFLIRERAAAALGAK